MSRMTKWLSEMCQQIGQLKPRDEEERRKEAAVVRIVGWRRGEGCESFLWLGLKPFTQVSCDSLGDGMIWHS